MQLRAVEWLPSWGLGRTPGTLLLPWLGSLPAPQGPGRGWAQAGTPAGRRRAASLRPGRYPGLWEAPVPKRVFLQQHVLALQKGNINIIIIILCI